MKRPPHDKVTLAHGGGGKAMRDLIETELLVMLEERQEELLERLTNRLIGEAQGDVQQAHLAAYEGLQEVERLLTNHTEAI